MAVLLVVVFLLVLFFAVLPHFLPTISRKFVELVVENSEEEDDLRRQLKTLQDELKSINMSDEFAKYAKTERKINRLKDEIGKHTKNRSEVFLKMKFGTNIIFHVVQVITMVSFIWMFRKEPLLYIPEEWLWPLENVIAFPTGVSGTVGITTWLLVCRSVVSKGIQMSGV